MKVTSITVTSADGILELTEIKPGAWRATFTLDREVTNASPTGGLGTQATQLTSECRVILSEMIAVQHHRFGGA